MCEDLRKGFPLADFSVRPLEDLYCITSDAAGISKGQEFVNEIGVGAALYKYPSGKILSSTQIFWPVEFITHTFDEKGKFVGCKTTLLELLGVLMAIYSHRKLLTGLRVVVE